MRIVQSSSVDFNQKESTAYRNYVANDVSNPVEARVLDTYKKLHTYQTVDFVRGRIAHWTKFDKFKAGIMETLERLSTFLDETDPDMDLPNIVHAFQTAERIRERHPNMDWFHLTGLIHDLGKIMAFYDEPQWAVAGDTFPVGCEFAKSIVFRDCTFDANPDLHDPRYNTKYGIYEPNCGLRNVTMTWGHDEYMYRVLAHNKCTLPPEALYIIRFHSFYPWHDQNDYMHLCDAYDLEMLPMVQAFQKFDLYTKSSALPDIDAIKPYYQGLIDKYIPGELEW